MSRIKPTDRKNMALIKAMHAAKFTQRGLAERSGVCLATISKMVNGQGYETSSAIDVAAALDKEVEELDLV